jgi:hypothetical protein
MASSVGPEESLARQTTVQHFVCFPIPQQIEKNSSIDFRKSEENISLLQIYPTIYLASLSETVWKQ